MTQVETHMTKDAGEAGIKYQMETINPEKAKEYLAMNVDNRQLAPSWVRTLAMRQKRDEWIFTGDPIRFDWNGNLRDGQHRLSMVIETGIPMEAMVMRGLDPRVFMVVDTGKKRGLETVFDVMKFPHSGPLASVIRDVWAYLADQRPAGLSHDMFVTFLNEHPDIVDSVTFYQEKKNHQSVRLLGFSKSLTIAHYLLSQIDRGKADDFITRLIYGSDTAGPLLTLRTTLIRWSRPAANVKKGSDSAALHAIIQVWNAVQAGKETKAQIRIPSIAKVRAPRPNIPKGFPKELFIKPSRQLSLIDMLQTDEEELEDTEVASDSNSG